MADSTAIEWTNATWNPVTGCTKIGPGCDNRCAEHFAERWRGVAGHPYEQGFDLTLWPNRLSQPSAPVRTRVPGLPRRLPAAWPARRPAVVPAPLSPVRKPSPSPSLWRPGAGRLAECRDSPTRGAPPTGTVPAHREYRRVPRPSRASGPAIREPSSRR
jgi:hypothetical protein